MLIENESQWSTADLVNMVQAIDRMPDFRRQNFYSETLILFQTSRKKEKKDKYSEEKEMPAAAVYEEYGPLAERYHDTKLILIRSVDKIGGDVFDRLANSDVQQDMKPDDLLKLVKETAKAIGGWRADDCDFAWVNKIPMRFGSPARRGRVSAEREIAALQVQQDRIRRGARNAIEKLDEKIEKIREKRLK